MKQTAVEWLIQKLRGCDDKGNFIFNGVINSELINQAKEMEKEQIKESWNDGNLLGRNGHILLEYNTGEQYYNETFKNK